MELQLLKNKIYEILYTALHSVDPYNLIKERLVCLDNHIILDEDERIDLNSFRHIFLCGAGKGVAPMSKAMEELLGKYLYQGRIIVKYDHLADLNKTIIYQAAHPIPDENGIHATSELVKGLVNLKRDDLVFFLLTGGGSALMELLPDGISLEDFQELNRILLGSGADIQEINCIRKHISLIKGGQLAKIIEPATCITLALSDVIGDDLSIIASGPTYPDHSTFAQAEAILAEYKIKKIIPENIMDYLKKGVRGEVPETPKAGDPIFSSVKNFIIGNNKLALQSACNRAQSLGFNTMIIKSNIQGEARNIALEIAAIIRKIQISDKPVKKPACILLGGEPTVTLRGNGKGGRNQELALALALTGISNPYIFLSCGTDGTDGPTDAAGAIVSHYTMKNAKEHHLSAKKFLADNDSYHFFKSLGDLIITGPTGTNVMDIMIALIP